MTDAPPQNPPRPTPDIWTSARADYEAGDTVAVIAERYGVTERTVFRHAADGDWRRTPFDGVSPGPRPVWDRRRTRREAIEVNPILGEINDARGSDDMMLLFDPSPADLRHFAFRRAAESAVTDVPQQAVVWMRLAQLLDRCGDRLDYDAQTFRKVDLLKAAYLARLDQEFGTDDPTDGDDPAAQG